MSECNSGYDARPQRPATRLRYFEDEPGRRSMAKLLSKDEARVYSYAIIPQRPKWLECDLCRTGVPAR